MAQGQQNPKGGAGKVQGDGGMSISAMRGQNAGLEGMGGPMGPDHDQQGLDAVAGASMSVDAMAAAELAALNRLESLSPVAESAGGAGKSAEPGSPQPGPLASSTLDGSALDEDESLTGGLN